MKLVAVLANPPLADHGDRTRARVELAADIIGCDAVAIVNLFPVASRSSLEIAALGERESTWLAARSELKVAMAAADEVLLGYVISSPPGLAGDHHRSQIAWTRSLLVDLNTWPWTVGGLPRHPSRWQRHTSRTFPDMTFAAALRRVLCRESEAGPNRRV